MIHSQKTTQKVLSFSGDRGFRGLNPKPFPQTYIVAMWGVCIYERIYDFR